MELIVTGTVVLIFTSWIIYVILFYPYISSYSHIPTAPQGNVFFRLFREPSTFDIERWMRKTPNEGLLRYFGFLNQERLLLTTPATLKQVMLRDAGSYTKLPSIRAVQGSAGVSGLVSAEGVLHKVHRRYTIGAFTNTAIRPLYPVIWREVRHVSDKLAQEASQNPSSSVLMNDFMRLACLDIFGTAGLGIDLESRDTSDRRMAKAYMQPFVVGDYVPLFLKLLQLVPARFQVLACTIISQALWKLDFSVLQAFVQRSVETRVERLESASDQPTEIEKRTSLIGEIVRRGHAKLSTKALVKHAMTTMAGCMEMVSNELAWGMYALAHPDNKHVQDRLRAEVQDRYPERPGTVTWEDAARLPYFLGVVSEILRLYSSVAHRFRKCKADTILLNAKISKGTVLTYPVWAMNRDPAYWSEHAAEMRPGRWFEEQEALPREQYAFMTFGQGVRKCPGEHYTRAVMACMLLELVRRFRFSLQEGADVLADGGKTVAFGIVMRAKIYVVVEPLTL